MKTSGILSLSFLFIVVISLTTCDNSIDPLDEESGSYSIFGILDLNRDTNFVRVKDLDIPIFADTTGNIDVMLTLRNLDRGTSHILKDSVINFQSTATNNFFTEKQIKPLTEYELSVDGSRGSFTTTTTTPNDATFNLTGTGRGCRFPFTVSFEPVNRESSITLLFQFEALIGDTNFLFENFRLLRPPETGSYDGEISRSFIAEDIVSRASNRIIDCNEVNSLLLIHTHYGPGVAPTRRRISIIPDTLNLASGTGRFIGIARDSVRFSIR